MTVVTLHSKNPKFLRVNAPAKIRRIPIRKFDALHPIKQHLFLFLTQCVFRLTIHGVRLGIRLKFPTLAQIPDIQSRPQVVFHFARNVGNRVEHVIKNILFDVHNI